MTGLAQLFISATRISQFQTNTDRHMDYIKPSMRLKMRRVRKIEKDLETKKATFDSCSGN